MDAAININKNQAYNIKLSLFILQAILSFNKSKQKRKIDIVKDMNKNNNSVTIARLTLRIESI